MSVTDKQNRNLVETVRPGSGKSFLMSDMVTQLTLVHGKVAVIDRGQNSKTFLREINSIKNENQ